MCVCVYLFIQRFGRLSYIALSSAISSKKGVINLQNIDQLCIKILAKHISSNKSNREGKNYFDEEHRYDFAGIEFPTPPSDTKIFERCNLGTSMNVYSQNFIVRNNKHVVYPLKVDNDEMSNHFDPLLIFDMPFLEQSSEPSDLTPLKLTTRHISLYISMAAHL